MTGTKSETKIEWTWMPGYRGATWNPTRGCTKISPGCRNCYAETFAERWRGVPGHPYEAGFDPRTVPDKIDAPLRVKAPTCWFVNSMSDLFLEDFGNEYIAAVFGIMSAAMDHRFLVLTKRAQRMRDWFRWLDERGGLGVYLRSDEGRDRVRPIIATEAASRYTTYRGRRVRSSEDAWAKVLNVAACLSKGPLANVGVGVSVEDQATADERIQHLLATPATVRFCSYEPALERVDFRLSARADVACGLPAGSRPGYVRDFLSWILIGGESGPGARPFNLEWARSGVEQCKDAGIAAFVKQIGAYPVQPVDREFATYTQWCNKASTWMQRGDICVDTKGRLCRIGKDFMRARDEEAFPVRIARRIDVVDRKGGDPAEWDPAIRVREFPTHPNWT